MRFLKVAVLVSLSMIIGYLPAYCQVNDSTRNSRLATLKIETEAIQRIQKTRTQQFAADNDIPLRYTSRTGDVVMLDKINEIGEPIFIKTDNAEAALTVGASSLNSDGSLGVNVNGKGIEIGVWDGGIVASHIEFQNRLLSTQGTTLSSHATHVTGTIIAAGINPAAKGMAPEASVYSWDFDNDESEMLGQARADETTLLFSNHSYGVISGWYLDGNTWKWFGNSAISTSEDYKFGFYSNDARLWDDIAHNAPFYSILKSAGNDRTDAGSGNFPADCNGGSGYDCISDVATAKNIICVGAIEPIVDYTGPQSVKMSSFSSWGPTDDGRIKPDFVAAGVGLFSTNSTSMSSYTTLSGTSMATPSATGSLALLQNLYQDMNEATMRASTLKALAIHTTKEAGPADGPDYKHGWGVLDVEAAAKVILNTNSQENRIIEHEIDNSESFTLEFEAKGKITATLVWTDLPGNVPAISLDPTAKALINDLDIRLVKAGGSEVFFPWKLNPGAPEDPASKGDNNVDNVERLDISNAELGKYIIQVSHKGNLTNAQQFSLIISFQPAVITGQTFFWIGNSGEWSNPSNWSLETNGSPANKIPQLTDRVIFDENSFSTDNQVITIDQDASCSSFLWVTKKDLKINFGGRSLTVLDDFVVLSEKLVAQGSGHVQFASQEEDGKKIKFSDSDFSNIGLILNGDGSYTLEGRANVQGIELWKGNLVLDDAELFIDSLTTKSDQSKSISANDAIISNMVFSHIDGLADFESQSMTLNLNRDGILDWDEVSFNGIINITDHASIEMLGNNSYATLNLKKGTLSVYGDNTFNKISLDPGTSLSLQGGSTQNIGANSVFNSTEQMQTSLSSVGMGSARLVFDGYFKTCYDNLIITGVDKGGDAVINVGENSKLTNANGWLELRCEDVLFADFSTVNTCAGSIVTFMDSSSGDIKNWEWNFGDDNDAFNIDNRPTATHQYTAAGNYQVTLTIFNDHQAVSITKTIFITNNTLPPNSVTLSNGSLFSVKSASGYQWYINNDSIDGETARGLKYSGLPAAYYVVTTDGSCNRVSEPYIVSGINAPSQFEKLSVQIFPNPAVDLFHIYVPTDIQSFTLVLLDDLGRQVWQGDNVRVLSPRSYGIKAGQYILLIKSRKGTASSRLVLK